MEYLPNELLINIFEYLRPSERFDILTVSHHWFEILQFPVFTEDKVIRLDNCIISKKFPPYKIFCTNKRSPRTFSHVTLNKIKFDYNNLTDMKTFFKKLGKDISHLTIDLDFDLPKFPILLKFFPKLQSLTLKDAMQLNMIERPFPDTLETLIVAGLSHNFEFAFIDKIPKLKTVKREFVNYYMLTNQVPKRFVQADERLKSVISALDVHAVIRTDLNYIGTETINIEHIMHLTCSGSKEKLLRIGMEFNHLKSLSFDFARTSDQNDQCFFGHETVTGFFSVAKLIMNERDHEIEQDLCEECFETFLDSFRNADNFTMHSAFNQRFVALIFDKLEKLRKVSLFSHNRENLYNFEMSSLPKVQKMHLWSNNNFSISGDIFMKWPSMPNLLHLEIPLSLKNIEAAYWIHFCRKLPSLVTFIHNCQKYCIDDSIFVIMTKIWPKLRHLTLKSAHKLTPVSFISLKNNNSSLKTLHLGRNWLDTGIVQSLFTNIPTLQQLEWTDGQTYAFQSYSRPDYYMANKWDKNEVKKGDKRDDDDSESSESEDESGKRVWGWIPKEGWGYWSKEQVEKVHLEPEFDARY